jgi:CubicO group peptidase (beta-lactamase class C family)
MPKMNLPQSATAKCFMLSSMLFLSACGAGSTSDDKSKPQYNGKPNNHGYSQYADNAAVSKKKLEDTIQPLFDDADKGETRAVIVMHKGKIVAEHYGADYGIETRFISWSMAKSVTSVLLGLMVADGRLTLDEPAPVPEWQSPGDPRGKITLRHLIHMESGLQHKEGADDVTPIYEADTTRLLFLDGRDNVARYAEGHPMEATLGTQYEYSTPTTHIINDIMTRSLTDSQDPNVRRDAMLEYIKGRLFDPLGMGSGFAEFDRSGTMLGGSMIHANARDWAKFGEFLRNNGSVRSAQLLPTSWIQFMRTSSPNDPAYGGHIWLNKRRPAGRDSVLFPDKAPSDVYAALGHLGQMIIVSPQHKLTIVRLGKTQDSKMGPVDDQLAKIIALFPKG